MLRNLALPPEIFDALGNPVRRQIVEMLAVEPTNVGTLAAAFTVSRPAISRHLGVLEEAGLVSHRAEGTRNIYSLEPAGFAATRAALESFWDEAEARLKMVAENTTGRDGG